MHNRADEPKQLWVIPDGFHLGALVVICFAFRDLRRDKVIWRVVFGLMIIQMAVTALGAIGIVVGAYFSETVAFASAPTSGPPT